MKRCPNCNRTYTDASLNFCLEDGTSLIDEVPASDPNATMRYPTARDTIEPPPTEIYRPDPPVVSQTPHPPPPPQWASFPPPQQPRKSKAIWWVLGGLAVVVVIGIGLVVMIIALASISSSNANNNSNSNAGVIGRNANAVVPLNANSPSRNDNSSNLPASFTDDFSEPKWGVGSSKFGDIWYADDEYHMRSKEKTYLVMYAPSNEYNTENATVKVTARSVEGGVPSAGFGLMAHCEQSKAKQLEDYALLIYPGTEPQYEVIMHKAGNQTSLVSRTRSDAIRSGSNPNQLEIRIKGTELAFYVNGQYLTHVTDSENYKRGLAGLYTSDAVDVAFDDLEIVR
jgi:hypothetical protein